MIRMLLALACLAVAAGIVPAAADEIDVLPADLWDSYQNTPPSKAEETDDQDADARVSASYCDAYGPGYELVPGTETCIRVGGHVQMDVYIRGRR
jgi:hypothetical protein